MTADLAGLGKRLSAERLRQERSQRELARTVGVSASLISQIEAGKVQPSVVTLMAIVTELDMSIDELLRGVDASDAPGGEPEPTRHDDPTSPLGSQQPSAPKVHLRHSALQNLEQRESIVLSSGVTWERLTPSPDDHVDFILVTYPPGATSSEGEQMLTHSGKEYWYVLSGCVRVHLVFDEFEAGPGDSFAFECTLPHRFYNGGEEKMSAVVMIVHNVG